MPAATSVVTAERFSQGLTFDDFLTGAAVNQDKLKANYENSILTDDDIAFFKKAIAQPGGPKKMMAIGEAWCGDVCRELPTAASIAEAAGIELRIFLRDQNLDIMSEFLSNQGRSRSIPVFVFYTEDVDYIAHFTERSAIANAMMATVMKQIREKLDLPEALAFSGFSTEQREAFLREFFPLVQPHTDEWRRSAVQEMRTMLAKALHL